MSKDVILQGISDSLIAEKDNKSRNSMGNSESWYNPNYIVGRCFTEDELKRMEHPELNNLIKLATYAAEAFY